MKSGIKPFVFGLIVGTGVLLYPLMSEKGQNQALEDTKEVLLGVTCSLTESDFKSRLEVEGMPASFEKMFGENSEQAWEQFKDKLLSSCPKV